MWFFLCFPTLKNKSNQNENQKSPPAGHSDHTAEYDRNVKNSIRIKLQENEQTCIFSAIKFTKKHARAHVGIKKLYSLEKIAW